MCFGCLHSDTFTIHYLPGGETLILDQPFRVTNQQALIRETVHEANAEISKPLTIHDDILYRLHMHVLFSGTFIHSFIRSFIHLVIH